MKQEEHNHQHLSKGDIKEFHPLVFLAAVMMLVGSVVYLKNLLPHILSPDSPPSAMTIEEAFQSNLPMLVYFYSDTCASCQKVKPVFTQITQKYQRILHGVSINVTKEQSHFYTKLFQVKKVPEIYFFNQKEMHKVKIPIQVYTHQQQFEKTLRNIL